MLIKQISAFIENKPGRLAEVTRYLSDENINILAISIADTTDFGILRLIVEEPDRAGSVLKSKGLTVKTTGVIAVSLGEKPGSLASVLEELSRHNIFIEYMYAFTSHFSDVGGMVILRLANQADCLHKLLNDANIKIVAPEKINQK